MNKNFINKMIFSLSIGLLMTATATAAPSLQGSTGLINTQTADILQEGQFTLGVDHVHEGTVQNVAVGVVPRVEVGVADLHYIGQADKMLFNAKYSLLSEQMLLPGLSVGVEDAFNKNQRTSYLAISKTLPFGFRIHAGYGNGRYHGIFGGLEKTINPIGFTGASTFPATTLIAEYDGSAFNYGARLSIIPGLKIEGGIRNHAGYYGINFTM
ncbi:hypothetical protein Ga0466249_000054 [Sporomusaceae bacterium BoRhaA]|uniref:YjbH domain-containing protein n=1 Tax=Pelorhabdus rhamnosifermentans TaxID=2772457 RepID=UPI001C0615F7|nr:YjbH domain-containing protein [Pelorhabdus rhamnosifermentans]MBU2698975.1 hypothetical protein [Pelorhabdus rhamnosifermentans]